MRPGPDIPPPGSARVPAPVRTAAAWTWRLLVLGVGVALLVYAIVKLLLVVLPVIGAVLLATVLQPLVARLVRRGWPALLATWTVLLGAVLLLAGVMVGLVVRSLDEAEEVDFRVQVGADDVRDFLVDTFGFSEQRLDQLIQQGSDALGQSNIGGSLLGGTVVALEVVAGTLLAVVLLFFFLKDGRGIWSWIAGGFGERRRAHLEEMGRRSWTVLSAYVRGSAIVGLVDAVLIGVALIVLGVPFVIPLVVLTFFAAFFPIVGGVTAGVVSALVALASEGLVDALILVAVTVVVQQVEGDVLQPLVFGRALRLHPVAILLGLTAGATLAGIIGAFLAVPVLAVGVAIGKYLHEVSRGGAVAGPAAGGVPARLPRAPP